MAAGPVSGELRLRLHVRRRRLAAARALRGRRVRPGGRAAPSGELAERLLASMPRAAGFDRVLFANSGSEANDVAWRIARSVTGRPGAIVSEFAYHGVTEATADLSPEEWPRGYAPAHVALVPGPDGYRGRYRREEPEWAERYGREVGSAAAAMENRGTGLAGMFLDPAFTSDGILCPPLAYVREAARAVRMA